MMVMNQVIASASPDNPVDWRNVNWRQCHKVVRSYQTRIVKAIQEGRWGKVKSLQRLLTHSFSGKVVAVKRVTENRGKKTPGVDGETWSTPSDKSRAVISLRKSGYNPAPLRRVYVPKENGKRRSLSIPTMRDRAMQALYKLALAPVAETTADRHSYGFRKERSTADAIEQCYITLACKRMAKWILEADIEGCFDNIDHQWLLDNITMDKTILKKWLKAGYIESGNLYPTNSGIAQGGIISPILANMALDGLGKILSEKFPAAVSSGKLSHKVNYIRYADDFVITGRSQEQLETLVMPVVEQFLKERGLVLSKAKTRVTHIDSGFDFLGQNIRKYNGGKKYHTKPSKSSLCNVIRKIRKMAKDNKTIKQELLIIMLNPVILGWTVYHRHIVAKESFSKLGYEVFKILWRWSKRRHPNKSSGWVRNKYFRRINGVSWRFACEVKKPNKKKDKNKVVVYKLADPAKVPIKRHVKIRSEANPYDKQWEGYFEKRLKYKMYHSLSGDRKLQIMWNKQKGKCPVCKQSVTTETDWDVHHVLPKSEGGDDRLSNLQMLHINCHKQIHSRGVLGGTAGSNNIGLKEA